MRSLQFDPVRVTAVSAYIKATPTAGNRTISKALGFSRASVDRILRYLRKGGEIPKNVEPKIPAQGLIPPVGLKQDDESCEIVTHNPCTIEDLLRACKVDLSVWRPKNPIVNKWEVGTKNDDGTVLRTPLYQIKVWLERIPGTEEAQVVKDTINWVAENSPVRQQPSFAPPNRLTVDDPHLFELNIPDLHFDKLAWAPESGENYDMKIAGSLYMQAVENLWHRASVFPVSKILFVIGNDFFTTNSAKNETAAGTPQTVDGRWQKSFQMGVALQHRAIEFLRSKAPVDVLAVPGNHDPEKLFYAASVLEGMYHGRCDDVRILNTPNPRKYYRWGTTLLGLTHGNGLKLDKLPLIMASEAAADWAQTTHREIHVGHYHHKRETQFHAGNEHGPVRVRILPALTATDPWHHGAGYVGAKKAAEGYLWSFKHGYTGHLSWSPPV